MFNPKTVPVFRVRKTRRGGSHYFRHPHTLAEKRINQRMPDETPARLARTERNIPCAYSDLSRCWQRTWKVQGKRRKAWDR